MKTLTWQKPGQQNVAQELIKIIINYVAELRININENGQNRYDISRFGLMERYLNLHVPEMLTYASTRIGGIVSGTLT